jgi:hypothetical protein
LTQLFEEECWVLTQPTALANGATVDRLDYLYVEILKFGIVSIRNASCGGDLDYCRAESEHLHEIPNLIGSDHMSSHVYHATGCRRLYLDWVEKSGRDQLGESVRTHYEPLWRQIDEILKARPSSSQSQ